MSYCPLLRLYPPQDIALPMLLGHAPRSMEAHQSQGHLQSGENGLACMSR